MPAEETHIRIHLEDGSFWATVDEYPGVFATGDTLEELRESLEEGLSLMLAAPGEDPPSVSLSLHELAPVETTISAELQPA
jgi:predicted RNase H-like HicB family nuclease